jgi:hypothetical protein
MQELTIHHVPATGRRRPRVRVSYRAQEGARQQERERRSPSRSLTSNGASYSGIWKNICSILGASSALVRRRLRH